MNVTLLKQLALHSTGVDGPSSEVTQAVALDGGRNAIQWEATMVVLTATNVSFQVQISNNLETWTDKGSPQTQTTIGRKMFTTDTAIAAAYVRLKLTITGTGKAILGCTLNATSL